MKAVRDLIIGDPQADRAVPPAGLTARLTLFAAAVMAFLAVFALALTLSTGRQADAWADELARTATLRLPVAEPAVADDLLASAVAVLETTPGVASARALGLEEQEALLAPWFGPDLPLDDLPIPQLVSIVADDPGYDADGLRARLQAQVPGAVLDDHTTWREPLVAAASRVRLLGWIATLLIGAVVATMITLAAQASLAANAQVIRVLRLVGAKDVYIARAFVRRFTLRALLGAVVGTVLGVLAVALVPVGDATAGVLPQIGFAGAEWLWPLILPLLAAVVAFLATRAAAFRTLGGMT